MGILKRATWCLCLVWCWPCCLTVQAGNPVGDAVRVEMQESGGSASLRGIAVRSEREAWVSGSGGTVLKTTDAGENWQTVRVHSGDALDFRDVEFPEPGVVMLMSAGAGKMSRLFRSTDDGVTWSTVLTNRDEKGFFNAMTFVDSKRGMLIVDPIDGRLDLYRTEDAGNTWRRGRGPRVIDGEYLFAASGTNVAAVRADSDSNADQWWIATGGAIARVFRSTDRGQTWASTETPMAQGNESSGIFSIAFRDRIHGMIVGGDYKNPDKTHLDQGRSNVATTSDGGLTWERSADAKMFLHKACVRHLSGEKWMAVGRTGVAVSEDDGATWQQQSDESFYTFDLLPGSLGGWLAGKDGRVARFVFQRGRSSN